MGYPDDPGCDTCTYVTAPFDPRGAVSSHPRRSCNVGEEIKNMLNRPYPLRIPEGVLQLAEMRSQEERTDKTTVLRQWLYIAAEEYAFKRLAEGRLTLSQTAALLDMSAYDVQRKTRECGIELGATADQYRHALETARQLRPQHKASAPHVSPKSVPG